MVRFSADVHIPLRENKIPLGKDKSPLRIKLYGIIFLAIMIILGEL